MKCSQRCNEVSKNNKREIELTFYFKSSHEAAMLFESDMFFQRVLSASLVSVTLAKLNLQSVSHQTMWCPEWMTEDVLGPNKWLQRMFYNFLWKGKNAQGAKSFKKNHTWRIQTWIIIQRRKTTERETKKRGCVFRLHLVYSNGQEIV